MTELTPKGRVLVVDDTPANRYVLARTLRAEGHRVAEATCGAEALERARSWGPELIVLDVKLPDMLGFDVAARLRSAPETRRIAILQVSASFTSADAHAMGLSGGADAYLVHPVPPQVLAATAQALLRMRHAEQRAAELLEREEKARAEAERARALAEQRELERSVLNGELEAAVRARDDLISMASHDLRGPLNTLQLRIAALLYQVRNDPESFSAERVSPKLEACQKQIVQLADLLDGLLDVSVIRAGHLQLELERVDFCELVQSAVDNLREQLKQRGATVVVQTNGPVIGIWDRLRLTQVIGNLLSNAIKYGGSEPIEIEVDQVAGSARLRVRDRGIGISALDQEKIFEPFERAHAAADKKSFGLGLWIVKRIVQALGGTIAVASEPGSGATFTVELPGAQERDAAEDVRSSDLGQP